MRYDNCWTSLPGNCAIIVLTGVLVLLAGCSSFGSKRVTADRFDYNAALARSSQEQLLNNIVRLRYLDFPTFLSIPSIVASYTYTGNLAAGATFANPSDSGSVSANIEYSETPTITYTPLAGDDFGKRLFGQIKPEVVFVLGQSGWPIDLLFFLMVEIINNIDNAQFNAVMDFSEPKEATAEARENATRFRKMVSLLSQLSNANLIEIERNAATEELQIYFKISHTPSHQELISLFKDTVDLDHAVNTFTVTTNQSDRKPGEVAIDTRSLFGIMLLLARGVDVPSEREYEGRAITNAQGFAKMEKNNLIPFHVRSSKDRPDNGFVSVKYRDYWYYIEDTDLESKFALSLVLTLFQLEAPEPKGSAPILALPAAR